MTDETSENEGGNTDGQADELATAPAGSAWLVVHARPRAEKKVTFFCRTHCYRSYLPVRSKTHTYGNRKRTFNSPLFAGYVFCCVDQAGRTLLRQNQHVANVLDVYDQAGLLAQLRQVRQALTAGQIVEVLPFLEAGHRVRVTNGPFRGLEGVVVRAKGRTRIVLNVDMIMQSVVAEVDGDWLAPA
jgi:transcription antitermination factor NusG